MIRIVACLLLMCPLLFSEAPSYRLEVWFNRSTEYTALNDYIQNNSSVCYNQRNLPFVVSTVKPWDIPCSSYTTLNYLSIFACFPKNQESKLDSMIVFFVTNMDSWFTQGRIERVRLIKIKNNNDGVPGKCEPCSATIIYSRW